MLGHEDDSGVVHPGSVLDAVDSDRNQLADCLLTEDMRGYPATQLVRPGDGRFRHIDRPQWREIADVSVDPVPDKLHPAVTAGGLAFNLGDQLIGLDFLAVIAEIALWPSDVPSSTDDLGKIDALVNPPSVSRTAGVAQQQRTSVTVRQGMLLGPFIGYGPLPLQTDVAMRINEPRHQPDPGGDSVGVGDRLSADYAVNHPKVAIFAFGQHHAGDVEAIGHGPNWDC